MSAGLDHCKLSPLGRRTHVKCNHCDWKADYENSTIAQRMASNHIVKKHPDIAKPANQMPQGEKRAYTPRKQKAAAGVNFCPCCGTNLNAIRVALSL